MPFFAPIPVNLQTAPAPVMGKDVGLELTYQNGEWIETLVAKEASGKVRAVLTSPTAKGLPTSASTSLLNAISSPSMGALFTGAPTFRFNSYRKEGNWTTVLVSDNQTVHVEKRVTVPQAGTKIRVELNVEFKVQRPSIEYLFVSYAFAPDGSSMSKYGAPDSTFSPGLRIGDNQVVGDHFFRSPAVAVQKGSAAAVLMPDVESLKTDRVMPTVIDLDCKSGVVDAPLLSYGFCDYRLVSHVAFAHNRSLVRHVPNKLHLAMDVIVDADAAPKSCYQIAAKESWKVGHKYFDKILPQAMDFDEYAKVCYPAAFNEQYGSNKVGWFDVKIDGRDCGGVIAGWGWQEGWVSWQCWFNNMRSAWGLRWWGNVLGEKDWVEKADKMLNMALAAPMDRGACPTTYMTREKQWKGCLIAPRKDCYYDLTNMAWKGIWLLKYAEDANCPRRDEIEKQCLAMADCMVRNQNADGSIPTWLTKDHKVVPILDHSAQTALPVWFLAEVSKLTDSNPAHLAAAKKGADFLVKNVIDSQLYYDFETFFSCSPKVCKQVNGVVDDQAMWDPHTMSPPQNTLCMQWSAEALRSVAKQTKDNRYMPFALKALDIMTLYQNVWPVSYHQTAYTFGGFGVQNSDGEYLDARQAQFGVTLADFGAQLGRQDYFERGVAATRAAMTLINHPLHDEYLLYPNPNYPLGLQPENSGHGGSDHKAGRTGFDWGEGSGLASMALILDKYGDVYDSGKWKVIVDGGSKGIEMLKAAGYLPNNPSWDFTDWTMKGWLVNGSFAETPTSSNRYNFGASKGTFIGTCEDGRGGFEDAYTGVVISPRFTVSKDRMTLMVGGGKGENVFVELVEAKTQKRIFVERGHDSEIMDKRTWDVSKLKGQTLQIRIVDQETGGWGHINVGDIRTE